MQQREAAKYWASYFKHNPHYSKFPKVELGRFKLENNIAYSHNIPFAIVIHMATHTSKHKAHLYLLSRKESKKMSYMFSFHWRHIFMVAKHYRMQITLVTLEKLQEIIKEATTDMGTV